jgi:DNA-binding NarL/FixJ family response regulator
MASVILTGRQLEVATWIILGKKNREIADMLFVDEKCIKFHNTRIFKAVGVKNRMDLTRQYYNKTLPDGLSNQIATMIRGYQAR